MRTHEERDYVYAVLRSADADLLRRVPAVLDATEEAQLPRTVLSIVPADLIDIMFNRRPARGIRHVLDWRHVKHAVARAPEIGKNVIGRCRPYDLLVLCGMNYPDPRTCTAGLEETSPWRTYLAGHVSMAAMQDLNDGGAY